MRTKPKFLRKKFWFRSIQNRKDYGDNGANVKIELINICANVKIEPTNTRANVKDSSLHYTAHYICAGADY